MTPRLCNSEGTPKLVTWGGTPDPEEARRRIEDAARIQADFLAYLRQPPDPELMAAARRALARQLVKP